MAGKDLSALFVPRCVDDDELSRVFREVLPDAGDLSLLIVEPPSGPAPLSAQFDDYRAISVWGCQQVSWDEAAAALSVLVPVPLLGLTWCEQSQVACWQTFRDGQAGPAHWEDDLALAKRGFARLYRVTLPLGLDLLGGLVEGARRGLRLSPELPVAQLGAAMVRGAMEGAGGQACCLLGHHMGDLAFDRTDPAFPPTSVEVGQDAHVEDHELIGELISLADLASHVDLTVSQQVFVTDLARRVLVTDKALTNGQRRRATRLLKSALQGSGSGSSSSSDSGQVV